MIISQQQHSELVTVVILSAFVPTLVAQQPFQPGVVDVEEEEALGAEDAATIRRHWGRGFLPGAKSERARLDGVDEVHEKGGPLDYVRAGL